MTVRSQAQPERRRNLRLRRLVDCAYGLSLCAAAGQALATEISPPESHVLEQTISSTSPRLVVLGLEHWAGSDAELQAFLRAPLQAPPELRGKFLQALDELDVDHLEFERQPLKRIKYGLAFDYILPQGGALHLTLYHRRGAKREGIRMALNAVDQKANQAAHRDWSLGLSSDFVRTEQGQRRVGLKPQLLLDLDQMLKLRDWSMDAKLEFGYWQSGYGRGVSEVRVAQASLNLRF